MKLIKKIIIMVITTSMCLLSCIPITAKQIFTYSETFSTENYKYSLNVIGNKSHVTVTDLVTNNISEIFYDGNTNCLSVDGKIQYIENQKESVEFFQSYASYPIYGPYKYDYDVNFESVGRTVGAILAIAAIATAILTAGLTAAVFGQALELLLAGDGIGGIINDVYPNASINGYFTFSQEIDEVEGRARNIDRKVYMRVGRSGGYDYYDFGDGSWFNTERPVSNE